MPTSFSQSTLTSAQRLSQQRQSLAQLVAQYAQEAQQTLRYRELVKGTVYRLQTRCGCPSCHCMQPGSARHSAMVLSWRDPSGRSHLRCLLPAEVARLQRLTRDHHQLRQSRRGLTQLHQQILDAIHHLEQLLLQPPPPSRRPPSGAHYASRPAHHAPQAAPHRQAPMNH
jgi:hypothetical protein